MLNIELTYEEIRQHTFKNIVKEKTTEAGFKYVLEEKEEKNKKNKPAIQQTGNAGIYV